MASVAFTPGLVRPAARKDPPKPASPAESRGDRMAITQYRLMVVMLMFIGITAVIGLRLVWLLAIQGHPAAQVQASGLLPARGDIVDRNGIPLATTIDAWSIAIQPPKVIGDKATLAQRLAQLLPDRTQAQYYAILTGKKKFVYLRRRAVPELIAAVNAIGEPGIAFGRAPERLYPQADLASHVLGYLDQDGKAMTGMEKVLDKRLLDPAQRGAPVQLSIDARVQSALEQELNGAMIKHSAIGASGIILDAETGEVLAMTSLPSFNPNRPSFGKIEDLANKSTLNVYELGSTFKMLTVANAIESGIVTDMAHKWDATAPLQVGRFKIKDDHPQNRWLTVPEVLVHSSNIATARIADAMGAERMQAFFRKMAFDQPAAIDLGARGMPLWPKYWARTTVMTTGFGHGIAVTPLHLASAYAALANGGIWRPATLMKLTRDQIPAGHRVISEATSARMRELMRLVVLKGTGRKADSPGMRVGGKTGTAEKPHAGGYAHHSLVSTFAGVFPMDHPRYVIITMLDEPHGTADTFGYATAAWTVGPVVNKVVSRVGPLLGIMPDSSREVDESDVLPLVWEPEGANPNAVE